MDHYGRLSAGSNRKAYAPVRVLAGILSLCCTLVATGVATGADSDAADVLRIYNESCVSCHAQGVNGAPRPGIKPDWDSRLAGGINNLYYNAFDGIPPFMPPRGLCMNCSEDQIMAVVDYMVGDRQKALDTPSP